MSGKTIIICFCSLSLVNRNKFKNAFRVIHSLFQTEENVELINTETLNFSLLNYFDDYDNLILIDLSNLDFKTGNIQLYVNTEIEHFLNYYIPQSALDVNVIDLISIARLTNRYPDQIAIISAQPDIIPWAHKLYSDSKNNLPIISDHINKLLGQWRGDYAYHFW